MHTSALLTTTVLTAGLSIPVLAADFGPANAPEALGRLVPDGAYAVAYMPSFNHFLQEMMTVGNAIDPAASQGLMMAPFLFSQLATIGEAQDGRPAPPATFKLDQPMAVAIGPNNAETGMPHTTFIMAADDADKVEPTQYGPLGGMHSQHLADYVSFSSLTYSAQASVDPLVVDLFAADLSLGIDQAAAVKAWGEEIDQMKTMLMSMADMVGQQAGGGDAMADMQKAQLDQVEFMLHAIDSWSWGIDLDGTKLDLLAQYVLSDTGAAFSVTASDKAALATLADKVPADWPMQFVMDASVLRAQIDVAASSFAGLPEETAKKLNAMMPSWEASIDEMKTGIAASMRFTESGIQYIQATDTENVEGMLAHMDGMMEVLNEADLGLTVEDLPMVLKDGASYSLQVNMDQVMKAFGSDEMLDMARAQGAPIDEEISAAMDVFLGGETVEVRMVTQGEFVSTAMGNDKRLVGEARRLLKQDDSNTHLNGAINAAYATPTWAAYMDIGSIIDEMYPLILDMAGPGRVMMPPSLPQGDGVNLTMAGSTNDDGEQVRVKTDLAKWIEYFKKLEALGNAPLNEI